MNGDGILALSERPEDADVPSGSGTGETTTIELDQILGIALLGVRRATAFMGLGVNAALREDFKAFQLSNLTRIQLLPSSVPEEELREMKSEFRLWVEACGFRELIETFGAYVDAMFRVCLLFQGAKEQMPFPAFKATNASFHKEGFPRKLDILRERFNVASQSANCLVSINSARNCLAHRRGVVGQADLRGVVEGLRVSWIGPDMFLQKPDGSEQSLNEIPPEGIATLEGGTVSMRFIQRDRVFKLREKIALSTRDLAEICWYFDREARSLILAVAAYAQRLGVHVRDTSAEKAVPEGPG